MLAVLSPLLKGEDQERHDHPDIVPRQGVESGVMKLGGPPQIASDMPSVIAAAACALSAGDHHDVMLSLCFS